MVLQLAMMLLIVPIPLIKTLIEPILTKVNDGELDSNISTVSVTINPVNDAPTTDDIATD